MYKPHSVIGLILTWITVSVFAASPANSQFEQLIARYLDEYPALSPVGATGLGDHRFDHRLNEVGTEARARELAFYRHVLDQLQTINPAQLSRSDQVDYVLLTQDLAGSIWSIEVLQEWAWNPLVYTRLCGSAIYGLMARDFAPLNTRLQHVTDRLEAFPRLFRQIRATLQPERVPRIHAETAVKQNRGVLSILENRVQPHVNVLPPAQRERLERAMATAKAEVETHQQWLEKELLPQAQGIFRLGRQRYDQKLAFTLKTAFTREQIQARGQQELKRVRQEMYEISKQVYQTHYPYTRFPARPSPAYQQAIIRACLELAYAEAPAPDQVVACAKETLAQARDFVTTRDLVTLPPDPLEIIIMPEFERGVALAYCDSPGPLDVGLKTFYAVAPLPEDWTKAQITSFLREYNVRSIHDLTMHEAMPGHFLQLAHANRYPGKLRALLASGVFIEGWAIYSERMMINAGYLDNDPLMRLINLKWYLRGIANALMDQGIHAGDMTREEAMTLMMEDTFQEEREAAAKWVRAQLTSAQLSTYFVGTLEHFDLRRDIETAWGDDFDLKTYHDTILSFGSPPVQMVRALILNQAIIPE
ncbi:MAG: DUF885 domain-containing protein [Phycisphaerae bacterium]|nr:DUF885 domain-containing protein [Phycisphaerae bacterium]